MPASTEVLNRPVRSVMEPNVFCLPTDMTLARAAAALADKQFSGAPVCTPDGRVVGVISKTDLAEHYGPSDAARLVGDAMTPVTFSVGPDDPIARAVELMAFEGVHRLLVIDGERLVGIVTAMDILRELAGFPRPSARPVAVAPPP